MRPAQSHFNLFDYFLGDERLLQIGGRTAIEYQGQSISYDSLRRLVGYWASRIVGAGVGKGDRVALLLYDSPDFVAAFLAAAAVGAVCVPINTFLSTDDIEFILADSGSRLVITEEGLASKTGRSDSAIIIDTGDVSRLDAAKSGPVTSAATLAEDPAFMLYTSGSTGAPKGVLHRHGAIPSTVECYAADVLKLRESDRAYSASRLFFAYGLGNSLSFPLAAGATVLLDRERPTPERVTSLLLDKKLTVFFAVPAVFRALLELKARGVEIELTGLRLCISAGEALPARIFDDWEAQFGLTILDGIGSTEMLHIFISNRSGDTKPGSSGLPVSGYEVRLLDDAGNELEGEQTGNLWVRGASAMEAYWNRQEANSRAIHDGWVKTGDIYHRDSGGYLFHVGRSDDCFKVSGLWVSPIEVESAILSHQAVVDAAVVPDVDDSGLATGHAYVVIRKGGESETLQEQLRAHAGARLPQYKVPSRINFVEELPRTSTGKIQRYKLRGGGGQG